MNKIFSSSKPKEEFPKEWSHWEGFLVREMKPGMKSSDTFARYYSRKTGSFESVSEVLKMLWLYCSFTLKNRRKYHCSMCKQNGHNCNTCPSAPNH